MSQTTGKYIIILGAIILIIGVIVYFFNGVFSWLGKLPGDVRIEKENFRFYFPFTTMVLLSAIINLIIWLVKKLLS